MKNRRLLLLATFFTCLFSLTQLSAHAQNRTIPMEATFLPQPTCLVNGQLQVRYFNVRFKPEGFLVDPSLVTSHMSKLGANTAFGPITIGGMVPADATFCGSSGFALMQETQLHDYGRPITTTSGSWYASVYVCTGSSGAIVRRFIPVENGSYAYLFNQALTLTESRSCS